VADFEQAQMLSARACALDPDDPIVLTTRGMVQTINKDNEAGEIAVERALAQNPYLPWAWERKGWLKLYSGDARGAIPCFGRALRFDAPTAPRATRFIGIGAAFFDAGDYYLSAKWMQRALQIEPGAIWVNRSLAVAYERLGERELAQSSLRALRRYRPDVTVSDVVSSLCFSSEFIARIANGLNDLGLSP
jgi:adenylate cyclase